MINLSYTRVQRILFDQNFNFKLIERGLNVEKIQSKMMLFIISGLDARFLNFLGLYFYMQSIVI